MRNKISVIVPIYNSEKYLDRCIESLLKQVYKNLEIILVNDGSDDCSRTICEEYARKYSNIILINKKNGGLGSARNKGIEYSTGDYIGFVDSDDWVDYDYFAQLYMQCRKYNAEISSFGVDVTSVSGNIVHTRRNFKSKVIKGKNILEYYMRESLKNSNMFSVCTSLFKKEVLNELRFREGKLNEDMDFKYKALKRCNVWVLCREKKYHYFQSGNSLSSGIIKKEDFDILESSNILVKLSNMSESKKVKKYANIANIRPYFSILTRMLLYGTTNEINDKNVEEICVLKLKKHYLNFITSPLKFDRKVMITCYCINYNFTKKIIQYFSRYLRIRVK